MKVTPLKKPITVTFDSVERAIVSLAYHQCSRPASNAALSDGVTAPASRLISFRDSANGVGATIAGQIREGLRQNGIVPSTWEPTNPIQIGSYTVVFKPGQIVVGCKMIANETVRAILNRLENPHQASKVRSRAVVDIHGDKDLAALVVDAAKRNGFIHTYDLMPDKAIILGGWYDSDASNLVQQSTLNWCRENARGKNITFLDARTQFGVVMDFLRNAKLTKPDIKIQGEPVVFDVGSIQVEGHLVPLAKVREIVKQLI